MASTADRKEYPISMRLPEADVAMIDRAATLRGRSRCDFVRYAAVRAAEEVVMEQSLIRMSPEVPQGLHRNQGICTLHALWLVQAASDNPAG